MTLAAVVSFNVFKRARSPFWWYWTGTGKERKFASTGIRRSLPLSWPKAFEFARMKAGAISVSEVGREDARWDAWVDDWLASLYPEPKQFRSLKIARMHWRFIRAFLGKKEIDGPAGVTYGHGSEYFAWRQKNKRLSERPRVQTAVIEMKLLRRVLTEARKRGFIPVNPLADLVLKKPSHKEKPEMTSEEEAIIRRALAGKEGHLPLRERWMTISFEIAIRHGVRLSETSFPLSRLNFESWDWLVHQKGDRWRTVPLHPDLRPLFVELRKAGAKESCVFPNGDRQRASYHWSLFLRGCERDNVKGLLPHLCFHCCRVTAISRLARAGVSEHLVMKFVGHESTTTHAIYRRVHHEEMGKCLIPSTALPAIGQAQSPGDGQTTP